MIARDGKLRSGSMGCDGLGFVCRPFGVALAIGE
jgi:hypothetical protein